MWDSQKLLKFSFLLLIKLSLITFVLYITNFFFFFFFLNYKYKHENYNLLLISLSFLFYLLIFFSRSLTLSRVLDHLMSISFFVLHDFSSRVWKFFFFKLVFFVVVWGSFKLLILPFRALISLSYHFKHH